MTASEDSLSRVAETISEQEAADMLEDSGENTTDQHGNPHSPVLGASNTTSPHRPTTPIPDEPNPDFADLSPNTKALMEDLMARPAPTNTLANTSLPRSATVNRQQVQLVLVQRTVH